MFVATARRYGVRVALRDGACSEDRAAHGKEVRAPGDAARTGLLGSWCRYRPPAGSGRSGKWRCGRRLEVGVLEPRRGDSGEVRRAGGKDETLDDDCAGGGGGIAPPSEGRTTAAPAKGGCAVARRKRSAEARRSGVAVSQSSVWEDVRSGVRNARRRHPRMARRRCYRADGAAAEIA